MHAHLCPLDYVRTPPTFQDDLANGRPNLDYHSSFYFCFGFLRVIHTTLVGLVPHFPLELDLLKTKSCDVDVDDELLPELVDNPGTTGGTKLSVMHTIVFLS